jgi:hypothetical protein
MHRNVCRTVVAHVAIRNAVAESLAYENEVTLLRLGWVLRFCHRIVASKRISSGESYLTIPFLRLLLPLLTVKMFSAHAGCRLPAHAIIGAA